MTENRRNQVNAISKHLLYISIKCKDLTTQVSQEIILRRYVTVIKNLSAKPIIIFRTRSALIIPKINYSRFMNTTCFYFSKAKKVRTPRVLVPVGGINTVVQYEVCSYFLQQ